MSPAIKGRYSASDRGSILLDQICERASVPPGCFPENRPPKGGGYFVSADVQWIIMGERWCSECSSRLDL